MPKDILQLVNSRVESWITYPGCDMKTLMMRKTYWVLTLGSLMAIVALTLGFLIFIPGLTILISYGAVLIAELVLMLFLIPLFPRLFKGLAVANQVMLILVTFIAILKLGGISSSAGLVFVGLSAVLSSIPLQNFRISLALFAWYTVTILAAGILHPWLTIPEQMVPGVNSFIFTLNTLWMSAYLLSVVLNNISQQKELEQSETRRLKELDHTRSKLITNITHEFRTPLTVIQGMTDLIRTRPDEWTAPGLDKIKTSSNILLRLVNQMLDLAKIETGAMQISLVSGNLNGYLSYLVELFRSEAVGRKIELRFIPGQHISEMDFDPDKLMHIVSNLLSNALRFTPQGGTVEVSTRLSGEGKTFALEVKDSGIGIEEEHLGRLFERFYQVENVHGTGGTGLGLALTKELVELLKGSITVESIPGTGSLFRVQLPVSRNAPPVDLTKPDLFSLQKDEPRASSPEENYQEDRNSSVHKPTLLIVEDNNDVVLYLQAILKPEYRVEVATDGRQGLEKALDLIPDILLSDVMMPEMDGIEMLAKVKSDIRTSHIPVVMLTAKADIESRLEGLEKGADAYLVKPFMEKELHIQLKNLVEIRKKLHERYTSFERTEPSPDVNLAKEDEFMVKVREALEGNLEDESYGISSLCRELAISHSQLYRKFSSLTDITISEYFKLLRLQKAKSLLSNTSMNVSEVAYAVGFKNISHFSREFARYFGISAGNFKSKT